MEPPERMVWPPVFALYRFLTWVAEPALYWVAAYYHFRMGGAPERLRERYGEASKTRPSGKLVWFNASSLGELRAALPVIERIQGAQVLVTTSTQSGAEMCCRILGDHAVHQFAPLDGPRSIAKFLTHWSPDLAVFIESDLPLRAIDLLAKQASPMSVLNARPSQTRSRFPSIYRAAFAKIGLVTAQDEVTANQLRSIGLREEQLVAVTDLKGYAKAPEADLDKVNKLATAVKKRPVWLAMSIHPEEIGIILKAHSVLRSTYMDALLIIVPRHPERWVEFEAEYSNLKIARRSNGEMPNGCAVYLSDTFGEAGTLFAIAPLVVVGGTFAPIGGHSPYEALMSGRPVVFGPYPGNHELAFEIARTAGAGRRVDSAVTLARAVADLWDRKNYSRSVAAVRQLIVSDDGHADKVARRLEELFR